MDTWDGDYNAGSLSKEAMAKIKEKESKKHMEEFSRRRIIEEERRGYMSFRYIPTEVVRANFARWNLPAGREYPGEGHVAGWAANRMMWICHHCGSFGFKSTLRETFKCYGCRSHNVQVLRAGEMSLAIRNIIPIREVGVNMANVFEMRKERLKEQRRAKRHARITEGGVN